MLLGPAWRCRVNCAASSIREPGRVSRLGWQTPEQNDGAERLHELLPGVRLWSSAQVQGPFNLDWPSTRPRRLTRGGNAVDYDNGPRDRAVAGGLAGPGRTKDHIEEEKMPAPFPCPGGCGSDDTVIYYEHPCPGGFTHVNSAGGNIGPDPVDSTRPKNIKCPGCSADVQPIGVYCNNCGQYFPPPF
jgi:hypothetical protein